MYKKIKDIPFHIFSNKECTMSPSKPLIEYLQWMYDNHQTDLEYLWRFTQQYVNHGGCYVLTYANWLKKLERDLKKQQESPT